MFSSVVWPLRSSRQVGTVRVQILFLDCCVPETHLVEPGRDSEKRILTNLHILHSTINRQEKKVTVGGGVPLSLSFIKYHTYTIPYTSTHMRG
jgi:hypothetical protein